MTHSQRRCLTGRCLSPGLAEGILLLSPRAVPRSGGDNAILKKEIEGEQADLDDAVTCISEDLLLLAEKIERQVDQKLGQVFDAHRLIVNDTTLRDEMRREIAENLVNASSAVKTVLLRWEGRFRQMDSNIATSKGDDLKDISLRLRQALAGVVANPLDGIPHGSVLVTSHLLPSDTAHLADKDVAAILVHHGSSGSHAALFTREMGIPCIAGIAQDQLTQGAGLGARVLIDAVAGSVILDPDADDGTAHSAKVTERAQHLSRSCQQAQLPATTADGRSIAVMANVGSVVDTERAVGSGADGIGLYRIEHIYLGRLSPPTADELAAAMRETLAPAHDLPVYVRLLDAGADKQLPFLNFALEANPSLGQRGIRLLRAYP
ncbi:MAG: PEP-utilizing enzyme, partial [Planctomycetota bacterium]|nr:PEP-utilizing enzyme [Planctomycetota bacterium]